MHPYFQFLLRLSKRVSLSSLPHITSVVILTGCAAQTAFQDGKTLVAQGKVEESLTKFQEAVALHPDDVQYRAAYLQVRERTLDNYNEQGDRLALSGQADNAVKMYQRALAIDPTNGRAKNGMAALERQQRQTNLLREADIAVGKKDYDQARQKVGTVLTESPNLPRALAIKYTLDEIATAAAAETQLAKAYKKEITIEFKDVALKQIFEVLSKTSGLNFLFDKDVKTDQKTSIFLKNSSIESAVHFVLLTNQLEQQVLDGNTILIYPNTAAKQKDYQELVVRTFYLTNAEAKTVANTLKTILKSRDLVIDEKLNMIIVRDTPDAIKMAEKLVALQDIPEPEVMLEVEVIEVQKTLLQNLGIQWPASVGLTPLALGSSAATNTTTGTTTTTPTNSLSLRDLLHQNKGSIAVSVGPTTANANLQDSDAKLLTNPRIRVRNHEKAKILIGERVPNITSTATATGFVSQSINYIDVGLTLNVEPTVYLDDDVGIKVSLEVSSIISQVTTQSGTSAYEIGTRTANTVLRLKNGETDVLAGLIDNQERTSGNKIPGLGNLPVAGRLFGATTDDNQKTEIVLSITPHLIRNITRPSANEATFAAGTESSMHNRPESSGNTIPTTTPALQSTPQSTPTTSATHPEGTNNGTPNAGSPLNTTPVLGTPLNQSNLSDIVNPVTGTGLAQLQWQGSNQVAVGGTVTLSLSMQSTQAVSSVPLTLSYDMTKLQVTGVTEGSFLKQGGAPTNFSSRTDNSGNIVISDVSSGGSGATGSAPLVTVTFKALAVTSATNVTVQNIAPFSTAGTTISTSTPAPFPIQVTQ